MSDTVTEKPVCKECGVDVRDDTAFCYNCGSTIKHIVELQPDPTPDINGTDPGNDAKKAALDDLSERFKVDTEADDKLAKAAAERKQARVQRKPKEYSWEADDESSLRLMVAVAVVISVLAGAIVVVTVYLK